MIDLLEFPNVYERAFLGVSYLDLCGIHKPEIWNILRKKLKWILQLVGMAFLYAP